MELPNLNFNGRLKIFSPVISWLVLVLTIAKTDKENTFTQPQTFNNGIGVQDIRIGNAVYYQFLQWFFASLRHTDLGSNSYKWKDLYMDGSIKDGTNTISLTDIANLITYAKSQGWIS